MRSLDLDAHLRDSTIRFDGAARPQVLQLQADGAAIGDGVARFADLGDDMKQCEIWLPQGGTVRVDAIRVGDPSWWCRRSGAPAPRPARDPRSCSMSRTRTTFSTRHPNAAGYQRMGERFARLALQRPGPLAGREEMP